MILAGIRSMPIPAQVIINEVCASNSELIADEDGAFPDWIELLNTGTEAVNLSGYCLRDDSVSTSQWCFPSYSLQAGEHLVVFASGKDRIDPPINWKTLITRGDEWRYTLPSEEIMGWRNPGFDDSGWSHGPSGIGYSDGDDATIIPSSPSPPSLYMRIKFTITEVSSIEEAVLHIDYDDGFVAYVNGYEIARAGVAGTPPGFNTLAYPDHEAQMYSGGDPERYNIASPGSVLVDGENVLSIEVHNASATSSDMSSIPYLTVLSKIQPGPSPPLELGFANRSFHTNFRLNADGDSLFLSDSEGALIDSFLISGQRSDHSFGRLPGNDSLWKIFTTPTPGERNFTRAFNAYIEDSMQFSVQGGRFTDPFHVALSSPVEGDSIYYSLDGSMPKDGGLLYSSPLYISYSMTVRAQIIRSGYVDGPIISRTYLKADHSGLPIISISTDPYNLWDYQYGMYANGPNWQPEFPHFGANFWNDWERPVYLEIYDESDSLIVDMGAGSKIFGAWSRGFPQKSLSLFARSKYGTKKINYPLFEDKPIKNFEALVFRNSGNDWFSGNNQSGTMFRDAFMTGLVKHMDLERQSYRQAVVYLNGAYWGIHNIREKVNEHFIASNAEIDPDKIELMENNQVPLIGSGSHYAAMLNFIDANSMAREENYKYVKTRMDIQNFINYELTQIYYDNTDWPGNNVKFWRPAMENGKWRWILYDTDFGFGMWDRNKVSANTLAYALEPNGPGWPNPPWSTFLLRKLITNTAFRNQFINSFADHMNTTFRRDSVDHLVNELKVSIENEMYNHIGRWGGNYQNWLNRTEDLKYFGRNRTGYVQSHIIHQFGLGGKHQLTVNVLGEGAGSIRLNTIVLRQFPWSGTYFEDVPIQLTAIPLPGHRFREWTGAVNSTEASIEVDLNSASSIFAVFESDPNPDPLCVIINEINYNSDSVNATADWIELANKSDQYVDLSAWVIRDNNDLNTYKIGDGSILSPHGFFVFCSDKYKFASIHSEVDPYQGNLGFGFSKFGDVIRLYNTSMELVDYVSYRPISPWPEIPAGSGYTLALLSPDIDNFSSESWRISEQQFGTPGKPNFGPTHAEETLISKDKDHLFQNAPNPFTYSTQIMFYSVTRQRVTLRVFDLNGRLADILYDGLADAGYHALEWTPKENSGGIYILRMDTPESSKSIRLVKVN